MLTSYVVEDSHCDRCKRDSVSVMSMIDDLEIQLGMYYEEYGKTYDEIMKKTKSVVDHMQATKHLDSNQIDYVVAVDVPEKQWQYAQLIARECNLRGSRFIVHSLKNGELCFGSA
jgi:hypothetical protein